jgi:hypothetical protein
MSFANCLSSFSNVHLPAACAAGCEAAGIGPLDLELFSASPLPYPSCRLHVLEDHLVQVSLRFKTAEFDENQGARFRAAFKTTLGFRLTTALQRQAYLPALDYAQSASAPPAAGLMHLEQAGSSFWRLSWDGPGIRLMMAHLKLINQGD